MRIRQIVFAAADLAAARGTLARLFNLPEPYRDPGVAKFGLDNAVFTFGDQFIEVVSPTEPGTACGRHLARHGDSGYMLIVQTDDLARERARFERLGVRGVWQAEHEDISATHLHPKDVGGAIVSVDEPRPAASWRWGGPLWRVAEGPAGQQRVQGLSLRAANPQALARRWAEVLGRPEPQAMPVGWRVGLSQGFADMLPAAPGQADGVAGFQLAVAELPEVLARAQALGLPVAREGRGAVVQCLGLALRLGALEDS